MIEADWLKAKDPDAMLRQIGPRLSGRQWHLLACAIMRRAWDVLPDGPLREAVEWAERNAGETNGSPEAAAFLNHLEPAAREAVDAARHAQREIVLAADPDADPESFRHADARKTNPSAPLFQAACRAAGNAVNEAGEAIAPAAEAVGALLTLPPGAEQLNHIRELVIEATRIRAAASVYASTALKFKAKGDEAADTDNGRNVRLRYSAAMQTVTNEDEFTGNRVNDLRDQRERTIRKALGRFLQEVAGNPFRPFRFEPQWRTSEVVGVARGIDEDRAFDRMPILADALLDADCDEEAVLRHCRGTEAHAPEGPSHARGCWVLDLILAREPAYFAAPPITAARPAPAPPAPRSRAASGWTQLLDAMRTGDATDPDDHDE
jgi:hypothetical protein